MSLAAVLLIGGAIVALVAYLGLLSTIRYECPRCRRKINRWVRACPFCGEPKRYSPPF